MTRSSGVFFRNQMLYYPVDCTVADLMSELAAQKEIIGNEMEKKIQDAEIKRIKALAESVKAAEEATKKTKQVMKLEEERNEAREEARQRRRDIDWLFSKRNRAQVSLAPELRWPSFPEISASSSSTRAGPNSPSGSTTESLLAGSSSSVEKVCGTAQAGFSPEMPIHPSSPTSLPT